MIDSFYPSKKYFDVAPAALWRWSLELDCMVYCSPEYAQIIEMTPEQAMARFTSRKAFYALVHINDRTDYIHALGASSPEEGLNTTYRIVTPKGNIKVVRHTGVTFKDATGKSLGVVCTSQDISEAYELQNRIAINQYLSRQAARLVGLGYWEWDLEHGRILNCSEEFALIHGLSVDEALQKFTSDKAYTSNIHPDDKRRYISRVLSAQRTGKSLDIAFRIKHPSGKVLYVREVSEFVKNDAGSLVRSYGAMQDLTELVELQDQLRQSQKLEVVGQLTGGIAHDFNNLLAVILGNAELLQHAEQLDGVAKIQINSIIRAVEIGADLTGHLLAFSRRQPLNPKAIRLETQISNMGEILKLTLGENIDLIVNHAEGLWQCFVDPTQLETALLNLVINARDAMPGRGKLFITTSNVSVSENSPLVPRRILSGDYVALDISDSGVGMDAAVLKKVFEPFFTTKEQGKGTGLGLSMVYGFVKQSNGHIHIESTLGQGTSVQLLLPRSIDSDDSIEREVEGPNEADHEGQTILLVEDDQALRMLIRTMLDDMGYAVVSASSGNEALEIVKSGQKINLLLSDVILPGRLNGLELAKEVKKEHSDCKVLFISGYAPERLIDAVGVVVAEDILAKPFHRSELAALLDARLSTDI